MNRPPFRRFAPPFPAARRALPEDEWPFELDAVFEAALSSTLALPGSGSVHFDQTHAAMMIDVDSGSPESGSPERTALATNLAAAETIARHIRLRNLGGGIVIDFVGVDDRRARDRSAQRVRPRARRRSEGAANSRLDPDRPFGIGAPPPYPPARRCLARTRSRRPFVKTAVTVALEALRAIAPRGAGAARSHAGGWPSRLMSRRRWPARSRTHFATWSSASADLSLSPKMRVSAAPSF